MKTIRLVVLVILTPFLLMAQRKSFDLTSPANRETATKTPVKFKFKSHTGYPSFQVLVMEDRKKKPEAILDTLVTTTEFISGRPENGKNYKWKVRGINGRKRSAWSLTNTFSTGNAVPEPEEKSFYSDVLVISNSSSQISKDVTAYFASERKIPPINICSLPMPLTEEIDSLQFESILLGIKQFILQGNLDTSINYIVTTQGVPLKVRRSSSVFSTNSNASSFDSDLCLMNSGLESRIGKAGHVINPYFNQEVSFSRTENFSKIYLVTRLGGYNFNDIKGLIDRAWMPYDESGIFVFDQDPTWGASFLNNEMVNAGNLLLNAGYNVLLDNTNQFVTRQQNVLGYTSWGSNDFNDHLYAFKARPNFSWSPKALAETYVSSSARSLSDSNFIEPTIGWQSMIADLIREGGPTGVKGYVFEPYSFAMARVSILFNKWINGYNLAESYYGASGCLGWMDVIIGDPKSTFEGNAITSNEFVSAYKMKEQGVLKAPEEFGVKVFPNPANQSVFISSNSELGSVTVMSITGQLLLQKNGISEKFMKLDLNPLGNGLYFIIFESKEGRITERLIVNK